MRISDWSSDVCSSDLSTGRSGAAGASGCEAGHPSWEACVNDRILWGQITAVFLIVLLAVWGATQWTAAALAFQPELGDPWFRLGDYPVYPPPAFFWWWFAFDAYAPPLFSKGALIPAPGWFAATPAPTAQTDD